MATSSSKTTQSTKTPTKTANSRNSPKKHAKSERAPSNNSTRRRWLLWLPLIIVATLAIIPILQVTFMRFWNPSITPLMVLRQTEARWSGNKSATHRRYEWRPLSQIPHDFLKAALISEDQRFFQHHGFDWTEVALARAKAERTGQKPRGASTITQQCARSLFLWTGDRSYIRKGLEAYYTFWMETLLPKTRILELYANVIEMGDGVYGIEAAARSQFRKPSARALTREECAALAAILPNPREWNPRTPSPKVAARIAKILRQEKQAQFPLALTP